MAPPSLAHVISESSQPSLSSRRLLTPTTNAIPLLSSPAARYAAHAHTLLIPLYYHLRSSALIRDPLDTLIQDLLPVAVLQVGFCATCLPSAGTWNSGTKDGGKIIEGTATVASKSGKGTVRKKSGKLSSAGSGDGLWGSQIMVCTTQVAAHILMLRRMLC